MDDRIGLIFEGDRVVAPGESICNTDVGNPVSYTVQPDDAGKVIYNHAVVTLRTQEDEPRQFQGTATSDVAVPLVAAPRGQRGDLSFERQRRLCVADPRTRTRSSKARATTAIATRAVGTSSRRGRGIRTDVTGWARRARTSSLGAVAERPPQPQPRRRRRPRRRRPRRRCRPRPQRRRRRCRRRRCRRLCRRRPRPQRRRRRCRRRHCRRPAMVSSIRIAHSSTSIWRRGLSPAACSAS